MRLPAIVKEPNDPCLICGTCLWKYRFKFGEFYVKQCQGCGLGRTHPLPTGEQQSQINALTYTVAQRLQAYRAQQKQLAKRYVKQLGQIESVQEHTRKRLLDVGCSTGAFLSFAKQQGYEAHGVELSEVTGQYARDQIGLDVFIGTLEAAHYPAARFDIVTLWDVIEHVADPINFLAEIKRILRPNGILAIQSPNIESTMVYLLQDRWNWWTIPDHIFHFSPDALLQLLKICGFRVVSQYTWEPSREFLENMLAAMFRLRFTDKRLKTKIAGTLVHWASMFGWPILVPFQRRIWRHHRGGLIVVYATNRP